MFLLDRNHAFPETDVVVSETLFVLICSKNCSREPFRFKFNADTYPVYREYQANDAYDFLT